MVCLRTLVVWPLAFVLLSGAASFGVAQEAEDDGLRKGTMVDEEVATPSTVPPRITIGDDQEDLVVRRRRVAVDPYAQQGIDLGAFRLLPSLEISAVAASNPGRQTDNPDGDVALKLKPTLRLESDWSRHSLTGTASVDAERFADNEDLKSSNAELSAALRLDVYHTTRADIDGSYTLTSTGGGSSGVPLTAIGKRLDSVVRAGSGVTHDFGGIDGTLRLDLRTAVSVTLSLQVAAKKTIPTATLQN